jgi:phosphate transport system permease protein
MIVPIVTSLSREVIATVPSSAAQAAYRMGATRWEMIRYSVLPWSRGGITGSVMLGLGRAMGRRSPWPSSSARPPRSRRTSSPATHGAVIANQFGEAGALHKSALIGLGVVLFIISILINVAARSIVTRSTAAPRGLSVPELDDDIDLDSANPVSRGPAAVPSRRSSCSRSRPAGAAESATGWPRRGCTAPSWWP